MKRALAFLLPLVATASLSAQVFLTSFGSNDFIDYEGALEQTEFTGRYFQNDLTGASFWGDFAVSTDITGSTSGIALTATVLDSPDTGFRIELVDTDYNTYSYDGLWNDFVTGEESTALLTPSSNQTDPFDFTQVIGLNFYFDSVSSEDVLDVTFSGLTAVPEPATCAALLGLVALGYGLLRRRRR